MALPSDIAARVDMEFHLRKLAETGYTVVEGLLDDKEVESLQREMDRQVEETVNNPYDPGDSTPAHPDDEEIEAHIRSSYPTCPEEEYVRIMRLIRHTRQENHGTPFPFPLGKVLKNFWHRPAIEDGGKTVYLHELATKAPIFARLAEDPVPLRLAREFLNEDCVLADVGGNSIGPHTEGGAWHVDAPLGQLPEPLPEFALTTQNVWMVDDFTPENGATRVVPGSHKSRKKAPWLRDSLEGEVAITGPAGSMAIWLSSTWHRPGPNTTDRPRRAVLCYFSRSWIKGWSDFRPTVTAEQAKELSPTLRYLLGFSSNPIVRELTHLSDPFSYSIIMCALRLLIAAAGTAPYIPFHRNHQHFLWWM